MDIFIESGLTFRFSPSCWAVRKYDQHEYYQVLSGAGLKGTDFVGIWKARQLFLIEVKNYRGASALPSPDTLAGEISRKVEDTFTGLSAIQQMLERKSLYRLLRPLLSKLPLHTYDWPFWTKIAKLTEFLDQSKVLFVLEGYPESLRQPFVQTFTRRLADISGEIEVLEAGEVAIEGLSVKR